MSASQESTWQPSPGELQHVIALMHDPEPGTAASAAHYQRLQQLKAYPEFSNYLTFVLACMPDQDTNTRAKAGLLLKNQVRETWMWMSPAQQEYVKKSVVACMAAPDRYLRGIVGTIISSIVLQTKIHGWPDILSHLAQLLDSPDPALSDSAFNALSKICEDMPRELIIENDKLNKPLDFIIPKFIALSTSPNESVRVYALTSLNTFLLDMPMAMIANIEHYMAALFQLASQDSSTEVRRRVCNAFVSLMEARAVTVTPDGQIQPGVNLRPLTPHMDGVINFMLHCCTDDDEDVALEASEFWSAYCEDDHADKELLAKYLGPLVRVLLKGMKYSDEEILAMQGEEDDNSAIPDRPEDIRPQFHRARVMRYDEGHASEHTGPSHDVTDDFDDEDDEDDEFDEDFDDDEDFSNWNLRKCSAAALDALANTYGPRLFAQLMPVLEPILATKDSDAVRDAWLVLESGVLALGAVAPGCMEAMEPHLPQLVPFLLTFLQHRKPLVRSITCWTLSRYAKWVCGPGRDHLIPLLDALLRAVLDSNKKVQEAACSALARLEGEAGTLLVPQLSKILSCLMHAYTKYQTKNLYMLYDAVTTLADSVNGALNNPDLIIMLMPAFMQKWSLSTSEDSGLFALLECLTALARSMGTGFLPYAQEVFSRSMNIVSSAMSQGTTRTDWDIEYISCALDLMSAVVEGLDSAVTPILSAHPNLLQLLFECVSHSEPEIRVSGFALLGDLGKASFSTLQPSLSYFLPVAARNLDLTYQTLCNNASWAIGELAIRAGTAAMQPHIEPLMQELSHLINHNKVSRQLAESAAVTIGRLGLMCPSEVGQKLSEFAFNWLRVLEQLRDDIEKEHAMLGMCQVVEQQPACMVQPLIFSQLCSTIASHNPQTQYEGSVRLTQRLAALLANFKRGLQSFKAPNDAQQTQWDALWAHVTPAVRDKLVQGYGM